MTSKKAKAIIITAVVISISIPIIVYLILEARIRSKEPMIQALQEQVNYLESRVVELEELNEAEEQLSYVENLEGEEGNEEQEAEEVVTDETVNEANGKSEGVTRNLHELIYSDEPEDWLEAAKRLDVTEEQLGIIAERAARINKYDTGSKDKEMQILIAKAVLENPSTTENVLEKFGKSNFPEVRQISVASMLTSTYPEDWLEAAKQSNSEEQLITIATKSSEITCYDSRTKNMEMQFKIIDTLLENPNTTKRVIEEFKDSRYTEVVEFAEEWLSSH